MSSKLIPPKLTMPELEAKCLKSAYAGAERIVEYGMGGSTLVAAQLPGKVVWSVESDRAWVDKMRGYFDAHRAKATLNLIYCDVGATGDWGMPKGAAAWRKYASYPLAVWDENPQPDLVFVDGRFRVGCVLAALFCAKEPLTLLFDDYEGRERYRAVEDYVKPVKMHGRMARFEIEPRPIRSDELLDVIDLMQRPANT